MKTLKLKNELSFNSCYNLTNLVYTEIINA